MPRHRGGITIRPYYTTEKSCSHCRLAFRLFRGATRYKMIKAKIPRRGFNLKRSKLKSIDLTTKTIFVYPFLATKPPRPKQQQSMNSMNNRRSSRRPRPRPRPRPRARWLASAGAGVEDVVNTQSDWMLPMSDFVVPEGQAEGQDEQKSERRTTMF